MTTTVVEDEPPFKTRKAERFSSKPVTPLWRTRLLNQGKNGHDAVGLTFFRTLPRPKKMVAAPVDDGHPEATPPGAPDVTIIDERCQTPGPHTGSSSSPQFQF